MRYVNTNLPEPIGNLNWATGKAKTDKPKYGGWHIGTCKCGMGGVHIDNETHRCRKCRDAGETT